MKQKIFTALFAGFVLVSCNKTYTCSCNKTYIDKTETPDDTVNTNYYNTYTTTKKKAEEQCFLSNSVTEDQNSRVTIDCTFLE
ncbi:MAG: hypothetical protein HYZ14_17315 [Bacteroidetes bacterium]|nr:hypothetical protein [Bacteroidota bacterium]